MSFIAGPGASISAIPVPASQGGTGASSFTANNVLLGNGTSPFQVVAPGASGNVLQSNGTTWTSASASSGYQLISSTSAASGASNIDVTTGITSTYKYFFVAIENIVPSATWGFAPGLRFRRGGVFQTTDYYSSYGSLINGANINASNSGFIPLNTVSTTLRWSAYFYIIDPFNATPARTKCWYYVMASDDAGASLQFFTGVGANLSSGTFDGFRLYGSGGGNQQIAATCTIQTYGAT